MALKKALSTISLICVFFVASMGGCSKLFGKRNTDKSLLEKIQADYISGKYDDCLEKLGRLQIMTKDASILKEFCQLGKSSKEKQSIISNRHNLKTVEAAIQRAMGKDRSYKQGQLVARFKGSEFHSVLSQKYQATDGAEGFYLNVMTGEFRDPFHRSEANCRAPKTAKKFKSLLSASDICIWAEGLSNACRKIYKFGYVCLEGEFTLCLGSNVSPVGGGCTPIIEFCDENSVTEMRALISKLESDAPFDLKCRAK